MPDHPQRLSLLAQTVDLVHKGILQGRWTDHLPQERLLCEQLNISRSTLRRALPKLEAMGVIAPAQRGVRRKISQVPAPPKKSGKEIKNQASPVRKVAWLTVENSFSLPSIMKGLYMELQKCLEQNSCEMRMLTLPHKPLHQPEKYMATWIKEFPQDAWVLHLMPDEVQQWFSKHQSNAYIFGNKADRVNLGSINIGNVSALTHAIHMLKRLGHQQIGLVRRADDLVGENQMETVFRSNMKAKEDGQAYLLSCLEDAESMHRVFTNTFLSSSGRHPTALFCTVPFLAAFALTWLQQHQFSVPGQVSIILLRSQEILRYVSPSLAHYSINESKIVPAALPSILDLIQTGVCPSTEISLIPDFVEGSSLGRPPA